MKHFFSENQHNFIFLHLSHLITCAFVYMIDCTEKKIERKQNTYMEYHGNHLLGQRKNSRILPWEF